MLHHLAVWMIEESKSRETESVNTSSARSTAELPSSASHLDENPPPSIDSRASSSVTLHEISSSPSKIKAEMGDSESPHMESVPVSNVMELLKIQRFESKL